jgi:hypothetical protein
MRAIAGNIGVVAQALGTTTDKAAGTVSKILDVNTSVQKLQELLPGLTASQVQQAQASQQSGDYAQILTERWALLTSQLERTQEAQRNAIEAQLALQSTAARAGSSVGIGMSEQSGAEARASVEALREQQAQIERNIALTKEMAANPVGPGAEQNQLKSALDAAEKLDAKDTERRQLVAEIANMEHAILSANQQQRAELEAGISAASQKLATLNGGGRAHRGAGAGSDASERLASLQQIGAAHQQEAEKEIADDQRVLAQLLAVHNTEADSARQVLQIRVQTAEQALNAAVSAGQMSAAQRLAVEQRLTQALYEQDLKRLQDQLATTQAGTVENANVAGQIEALEAQHYQKLQALEQQYEQAKLQQQQKSVAERKKMVKEVEGYENQMLSGLISGRTTFANMERNLFQQLAAAEIESALHVATEKLLITRTADSQTRAIKSATGIKAIGADAAQAAAGAYKAIVGIPYVGPFLAPAAAAAAFAAVGAYESLVSFDVGAYNVPKDMVAQIHAGEMILPRPFADDARRNGGIGGLGGAGGDTYHVHVHTPDAEGFERLLSKNSGTVVRVMRGLARTGAFK